MNLHALEYPTMTSDLSLVSFRTPGLPSRLSSVWEIQRSLKLPTKTLGTVYDMIYPMIEGTIGMRQLLQENRAPPCLACDGQDLFRYDNALVEKQTRHYCPRRSEKLPEWLARTKQSETNTIKEEFDKYNKFNFNSEHSQLCRANRSPAMALAHVASNTFTLFSMQSSVIILMYIATVNILFMSSITIYLWYGHKIFNTPDQADKLKVHGQFAVLFFVVMILALIPVFADYFRRGEDTTKSTDDTKAIGSYVLGLWTIMYAFVYIKIIPPLLPASTSSWFGTKKIAAQADATETDPTINVAATQGQHNNAKATQAQHDALVVYAPKEKGNGRLVPRIEDVDVELATNLSGEFKNGYNTSEALPTPDDVVQHFYVQQPVICFSYWNLVQAPCVVMAVLTQNKYGIDLYMQFVFFGTIAVCLLDVLQTRVMVLLGVIRKIKCIPKRLDYFTWVVFLFLKCIIAVPVLLKLQQTNIEFLPVATIALMFYTQTLQNIILLMFSRRRKYDDLELHTNMQEKAFHVSLYWHVLVSCVVFFSLMIT